MRHRATAALLVGAALVLTSTTATGAGAAAKPSLFPLASGKRFVLFDAERNAELRILVRKTGTGFTLDGFPGLGSTRVRATDGNVEAWDTTSDRWEPFLRLAAPVGTRYTVDLGATLLWRRVHVTVASRNAECENALGRPMKGCVKLVLRARSPVADAGIEQLVFAPGLGLAEVVETTIAGARRFALSPRSTTS